MPRGAVDVGHRTPGLPRGALGLQPGLPGARTGSGALDRVETSEPQRLLGARGWPVVPRPGWEPPGERVLLCDLILSLPSEDTEESCGGQVWGWEA